jgi:MFS family permease
VTHTIGKPADSEGRIADDREWAWRSQAYAWFVVVILALGLTLSFADRMILALMIGPIKHDLHLTDSQVGLVHGLAFTLLYVVAGLPLGRIADNGSRRGLIAASIVAWSLATAACAAATSFASLFAARLAVGIGEAGLSPAGMSMVSDYFPPRQRARPLTFLVLGASAGTGVSFMIGGVLMKRVGAATMRVPLIGALHGWQVVFLLLGMFGLMFSFLLTVVREPPRHERAALTDPSVAAAARLLWNGRIFFATQFVGIGLSALVGLGFNSWMPAMLSRRFGWDSGTTGLVFGACAATGGISGTLLAGWLARRLDTRGVRAAAQKVTLCAVVAAILPMTLGPLLENPSLVVASVAIGGVAMIFPATLAPVTLQEVVPNEFRGQVFAVYLLVLSLIGYAIGPFAVAFVSDSVLRDESKVHISLAIVSCVFLPLSALILALGLRARRVLDRDTDLRRTVQGH